MTDTCKLSHSLQPQGRCEGEHFGFEQMHHCWKTIYRTKAWQCIININFTQFWTTNRHCWQTWWCRRCRVWETQWRDIGSIRVGGPGHFCSQEVVGIAHSACWTNMQCAHKLNGLKYLQFLILKWSCYFYLHSHIFGICIHLVYSAIDTVLPTSVVWP